MDAKFPVRFDGKCYDIKKFMRDHPGGVNMLKHFQGKSIKNAMEKFNHSTSAYHMLNDFKVTDSEKDVVLTGEVSGNGRIITSDENSINVEEIAFLEDLEARLDWSKPIFCQLEAIAPHYDRWVHSPVYRQCRLFANPVVEALTYTPWFLVPMFWMPIIAYIAYSQYFDTVECGDSCKKPRLAAYQFVGYLAFGTLVVWTVLEYIVHRWVFHLNPGSSSFMIKFHFVLHGLHHKVPFDRYRQVFPPLAAVVVAFILYSIIAPLFTYPRVILAGTLMGYLTYDMIHYYVHQGSPKDGSYLYMMKRYHSNHHFVNHDKAFGISNKLWDIIFRTFVNVRKLDFSLHW